MDQNGSKNNPSNINLIIEIIYYDELIAELKKAIDSFIMALKVSN
jgi:hypothetical protein